MEFVEEGTGSLEFCWDAEVEVVALAAGLVFPPRFQTAPMRDLAAVEMKPKREAFFDRVADEGEVMSGRLRLALRDGVRLSELIGGHRKTDV